MSAIGLQSHIWNNNAKSVALLAIYPFIILLITWLIALVLEHQGGGNISGFDAETFIVNFWPLIFTAVGIWFLISYFFHTRMVRGLSHSHPVTRSEEPELYNLLENLCIAQGIKTPKFEIIETHARNAFASGIDDKNYTVTVTRGLLQSLSKDEVEAVLAHELAHIINRDVRLLIISIIFTSMLGFAAQIVWSSVRYSLWVPRRSSGNKKGNGIIILLIILAILWAGYFATIFTRFALSRRREYMADAGAVQMTKNPEAMMRALMRIAGMEQIPKMTDDVALMCIENSKPFFGLFQTHPKIEDRIQAISQTTNTPVPDIPKKIRASGSERFSKPAEGRNNWATRERFKSRKANPWAR